MPGGITEDTFVNITFLIVLGNGHDHVRAMIQRDMQAATKDNPFPSDRVLAYAEQDLQLLLGDEQRSGTSDSALALMTQPKRAGTQSISECSNCHRRGHTADWYIRPGGGMAGKSIEEAQTAQRNAKKKGKSKDDKDPKQKISLSFKHASGRAFIAKVDADSVTAANSTVVRRFVRGVVRRDGIVVCTEAVCVVDEGESVTDPFRGG